MRNFLAPVLVVLMLAGCSAPENLISFNETSNAGQQIRQLSFALTNEPAKTCIEGNWRVAELVKGRYEQMHDPAYELKNGNLEVLLDNFACDAYDSYIGTLSGGQFHGKHVRYGLGHSNTLGNVSGTYANK